MDVRFISATNREPQEAVDQGALRGDLFYRLRVVPIKLPPLRKRPEDIPMPGESLSDTLLGPSPADGRQGSAAERGEHRLLAFPTLAGQCSGIAERVAPCGAGRARPVHPAQRYSGVRRKRRMARRAYHPPGVMDEAYHPPRPRRGSVREGVFDPTDQPGRGNMSKAARLASIDRTTLYRLMEKQDSRATRPRDQWRDTGDRSDRPDRRPSSSHPRCAGPAAGLGPRGPVSSAVAPALWDALKESVLSAEPEWERAVQHAAAVATGVTGASRVASRPMCGCRFSR